MTDPSGLFRGSAAAQIGHAHQIDNCLVRAIVGRSGLSKVAGGQELIDELPADCPRHPDCIRDDSAAVGEWIDGCWCGHGDGQGESG